MRYWNSAPESVKAGFVIGHVLIVVGVVLIAVSQFLDVSFVLVLVGGACLGGGVGLRQRLTKGRFSGAQPLTLRRRDE